MTLSNKLEKSRKIRLFKNLKFSNRWLRSIGQRTREAVDHQDNRTTYNYSFYLGQIIFAISMFATPNSAYAFDWREECWDYLGCEAAACAGLPCLGATYCACTVVNLPPPPPNPAELCFLYPWLCSPQNPTPQPPPPPPAPDESVDYTCSGGTTCDGTSITGSAGQSICGSDLRVWTCSSVNAHGSGTWYPQQQSCECPVANYSCSGGVRCDGTQVPGSPNEQICGMDLQTYACTRDGWEAQGSSCSCEACPDGGNGTPNCPLRSEVECPAGGNGTPACPYPPNSPIPDHNVGTCEIFFGERICGCERSIIGTLNCGSLSSGVTCNTSILGINSCYVTAGSCLGSTCCPQSAELACTVTNSGVHVVEVSQAIFIPTGKTALQALTTIAAVTFGSVGQNGLQAIKNFMVRYPDSSRRLLNEVIANMPEGRLGDVFRAIHNCGNNTACKDAILNALLGGG